MVDFDATSNFMARAFVKREEYFTQKKSNAYNLIIVDKNPLLNKNKKVNKKTKSLSIAI